MEKEQKRFSIWYVLLTVWALIVLQSYFTRSLEPARISYTEFKAAVAAGRVEKVAISQLLIRGSMKAAESGEAKTEGEAAKEAGKFETVRVEDTDLLRDLSAQGVEVTGEVESTFWHDALSWIVPTALLVAFWIFLLRRMGQGQSGFMTVGRSKAKVYMEKEVKVSFDDVAGVDEAKQELREVIDFLKTPDKFRRLGGKIPKGILLVGPPGTGKTLLARAVAGEAGVPFFSISGSEFVEMFVGVGAARVRDLFLQAKSRAPCIIFIDELDALGKARGIGPIAHEEREQTLNQLLVEMDGFDPHAGVILMAATNRPEILDPALLRPGRFDRHVVVDRPDKIGRLAVLRLHARGVPLGPDADLGAIAAMTAGFAGADLANVVNEAVLLTARRGKEQVGISELQEAVERIVAGLEKKNRVLNPMEKERVAHHEVGHAIVALSIPGSDAVRKISIIPRGVAALGYTLQVPTEDRFLMTRSELENKIAVLLGGRVAEEIVFAEVSTGAQNDLAKATDIAASMVKAYGMSDKLGQVSFERDRPSMLLPVPSSGTRGDYSEQTSREIDCEVRAIIDRQHARVRDLLERRRTALCEAAALLLERETIGGEELAQVLARIQEKEKLAVLASDSPALEASA